MRIRSIPVVQNGTTLYVGAAKAGELAVQVKVDMRTTSNSNGYQREVSPSRARSFGRYISRTTGISPNTILLNVRNANSMKYKDGFLTIEEKEPLWLVDGQHRVKGLEIMMAEDGDPKIGDFELPVVVMSQGDNYTEAKQFWIINKTQKGVRSDLAERILQRAVYEEGKKNLIQLSEQGILGPLLRGFEWKEKALAIADAIQTRPDSPWHGIIRMPNDPKDRHVLAAAVVCKAQVIVTQNLRHFPQEVLAPFEVETQSPDEFLTYLFYLVPKPMIEIIEEQAGDLHNPPQTVVDLLRALALQAPNFATLVRDYLMS